MAHVEVKFHSKGLLAAIAALKPIARKSRKSDNPLYRKVRIKVTPANVFLIASSRVGGAILNMKNAISGKIKGAPGHYLVSISDLAAVAHCDTSSGCIVTMKHETGDKLSFSTTRSRVVVDAKPDEEAKRSGAEAYINEIHGSVKPTASISVAIPARAAEAINKMAANLSRIGEAPTVRVRDAGMAGTVAINIVGSESKHIPSLKGYLSLKPPSQAPAPPKTTATTSGRKQASPEAKRKSVRTPRGWKRLSYVDPRRSTVVYFTKKRPDGTTAIISGAGPQKENVWIPVIYDDYGASWLSQPPDIAYLRMPSVTFDAAVEMAIKKGVGGYSKRRKPAPKKPAPKKPAPKKPAPKRSTDQAVKKAVEAALLKTKGKGVAKLAEETKLPKTRVKKAITALVKAGKAHSKKVGRNTVYLSGKKPSEKLTTRIPKRQPTRKTTKPAPKKPAPTKAECNATGQTVFNILTKAYNATDRSGSLTAKAKKVRTSGMSHNRLRMIISEMKRAGTLNAKCNLRYIAEVIKQDKRLSMSGDIKAKTRVYKLAKPTAKPTPKKPAPKKPAPKKPAPKRPTDQAVKEAVEAALLKTKGKGVAKLAEETKLPKTRVKKAITALVKAGKAHSKKVGRSTVYLSGKKPAPKKPAPKKPAPKKPAPKKPAPKKPAPKKPAPKKKPKKKPTPKKPTPKKPTPKKPAEPDMEDDIFGDMEDWDI